MNLGFRQIFITIATLLSAIIVPAQEIPVLPGDPSVSTGVLPNGMTYYLAVNPDAKGIADFALVQKVGARTSGDYNAQHVKDIANETLTTLKRVNRYSLEGYLTGNEVIPADEGFVKVMDDATVFRFNDVRLNAGKSVMDSTLIMIMDIADRANYSDDEFVKKWYSPADQAVIVSGDIDAKAVASKLLYMSYMVPARESAERPQYTAEEKQHSVTIESKDGISEISAVWTSKRAPREYMNTVQPEIFEMSLHTLGEAAVHRIRHYLKEAGVPAADVSYSHICSSEYPYDDSFTVHVAVAEENAGKAQDAVSSVMSSIDERGMLPNEYIVAESVYIKSLSDKANAPTRTNEEYIERCTNAFLYNASLASPKERLAFHTSRNLPDTMRQRLFNGIASAIIDTVVMNSSVEPVEYTDLVLPDTLEKPLPPTAKIKLKTVRKEPVSGGAVWTFSNGFKVIYKKVDSDRLHYCFALNGGYGGISRLAVGEGAFVADYLNTCRISGMDADELMMALKAKGITMDVAVNLSNMMISGSLPDDRLALLLRTLLAVANERETGSPDGYEYFKESEYLALDYDTGSLYSRMTAIDSIMCPGYRYSPYKVKGKMTDGFSARADSYFDSQFEKTNDGALVLVGNLNEDNLKKLLLEYVGHFRTSDAVAKRPVVRYQPVSGWSTYTVGGDMDNVDVVVSTRMPLTSDNFFAADLASMVMKREMARQLNMSGMHFNISVTFKIYPEERLNVLVSVPSASLKNLSDVRSAFAELRTVDITDDELKSYKETLKSNMVKETRSPEYWVDAIVLRYLEGKDLTTNYAARIDALNADKVKAVLTLLDGGSKVEYVTMKK